MKEEIYETVDYTAPSLLRRVSWGAIFAGLFVTIVIQLMLTLLGVAIGAASFDPWDEQNPGKGLAIGSAIWLLISSLLSIFAGSCVAGRLSGGPRPADGMLHGIITWSASTVLTLFLLATSLGFIVSGAGSLLQGAF